MFSLGDFGWFKKKLDSGKESRDFRYTKGNCKHYGSKAADIFAGIAAIGFIVPLLIDVFNTDSRDNTDWNNNRNSNKRRH